MTALNKDSSDPSLTRPSVLWLGMNLETSLFKQGWNGGGVILARTCNLGLRRCDSVYSNISAELGR